MPTLIRWLTAEGLIDAPYTAESLADAARHEPPDGVYTVANTFNTTQVLKLDSHLDRMEDSARRAGIDLRIDRPRLRAALRQMILDSGFGDVRYRITARDSSQFILTIEPFKPLAAEVIAAGVRCVTAKDSARHNPAAKVTGWMHARQEISLPPGAYEALLLDAEGRILEGTGSNFWAIMDGELRTAGEDVLPGIAQQIVFEIAPPIIPVRREAVHVSDLPGIDEAFITSSSRGIVPVVAIDDHIVGDGAPGSTTLALRAAYVRWVEQHLEEL
jgi:branched-chain amino acid aminotransferase